MKSEGTEMSECVTFVKFIPFDILIFIICQQIYIVSLDFYVFKLKFCLTTCLKPLKMDMETDDESPRSDDFLSKPGTKSLAHEIPRISANELAELPEESDWSLVRKSQEFNRQYARAYHLRLTASRPILENKVKEEWAGIPLKPIAALCEYAQTDRQTRSVSRSPQKKNTTNGNASPPHSHEQHISMREDITVAILGTIFKVQPDKPSILQELVEELQINTDANKENFVSEKDILMIEDETARARLIPYLGCGFTTNDLVNGVVCAVKGKPNVDGQFEVTDVIWATPKPSGWPLTEGTNRAEMVFISGLQFGSLESSPVQLGMLFEYLEGLSGSAAEQEDVIGKRTKVFLLGNSFSCIDANQADRFKKTAELVNKLDLLLSNLAKTMEVFVISGKTDPVESMYPQPPIHSCLFPLSKVYPSFHLLSNPTRISVETGTPSKNPAQKLDIIFSDGEAVVDAMRYSDTKCPLEMAKKLLQWGHLCPTAPDTLSLHPGVMSDIFILKDFLPNMFVIGNQKEMGMTQWNGTMIVSVPAFATTGKAVVFTTESDCVPVEFNIMV